MRQFPLLFLFAIFLTATMSAEELTIEINNVEKADGVIYVGIYATKEAWEEHVPTHSAYAEAKSPQTTLTVEVPVGIYAISLFQDLNGNNEMDYNAIRMPKEPWGVSNDAPSRFGPPKWDAMKFEVGDDPNVAKVTLNN